MMMVPSLMLAPLTAPDAALAQGFAILAPVAIQPAALPQPVQVGAPARLDELVQMLESPDLSLREIATQSLRDNSLVTLEVVEKLLQEADGKALSLEQRVRLETIGREKFVRRPRGALGVQFGMLDDGGEGVVVAMTIRGFHSADVLQPGDTIVMMDTTPIKFNDDARAAIISHEPGEVVNVQIKRLGEAMKLSIRLGSFAALTNAARLDTPTMERAWEIRRARQDLARPTKLIDTGLSTKRFGKLASLAIVELDRRAEKALEVADPLMPAATPSPGVVAGGQHRRPTLANNFVLNTNVQVADLARIEQEIQRVAQRLQRNNASLLAAKPQDQGAIRQRIESDKALQRQLMKQRDQLLINMGAGPGGPRVK